jgi:hypothetical protein
MTISKTVLNNIAKMSEAELLELNKLVVSKIKTIRRTGRTAVLAKFAPNDKVIVDGGNRYGFMDGVVVKVNKVNLKVDTGFGVFTVSPNLCKKA